MARRRSGIQGVPKLRRTLRRIEPEASDEVRVAVREGAQAITADALAKVPVDEGDLARSIDYRLGRDGLTALIGPAARQVELAGGRTRAGAAFATGSARLQRMSIKNKQALFEFFKGYWVEYGTKGGGNVPRQSARPFMRPAWDMNRAWLLKRVQSGLAAALTKAVR